MAAGAGEVFGLQWRRFVAPLPRPLLTAHGPVAERRGWLLRLTAPCGAVGWGEAAPLAFGPALAEALDGLEAAVNGLGASTSRSALQHHLFAGVPVLGFALGSALAEAEGLVGGRSGAWLPAPAGSWLLPAGPAALPRLAQVLAAQRSPELVFKWKVAVHPDAQERAVLEQLLASLPAGCRLRLDANGHWDRATAAAWADRLAGEPRLQWLEQPLPPTDVEGLEALAERLPVALDESLRQQPQLRQSWRGWQVRRPSQEGDPRPLLAALQAGQPNLVLSTGFETGIARRWLHHLAGLQALGPTPAAPGLARDWQPTGALASADPQQVWEAAA